MNREIRFRVWDRDSKKWVKHLTYCIDDFSMSNKEWHILMQYTGLKDKNGVEIYEGDILTKDGIYNREIKWFKNGFWSCQINSENKFPLTFLNEDGLTDFEVIGNIYQNSELIK